MSCILIVDDDESICLAMSEVLMANGYDVVSASNGIDAVEHLEKNIIDIVLLDIFMPQKDGFETIGDLRRYHPNIKIIAMSGYSENRFNPLNYAKSLGANEALAKPFSADELLVTLKTLLD